MSIGAPVHLLLYELKYKALWDEFVRQSKNGVFLFYRDYMEYHADRFSDFSLMFFQDGQLLAIMPANRTDDTVESHGGLTFGGIISDSRMTAGSMLDVFSVLTKELRDEGVRKLVYKAIPHIYHSLPAEEDAYALFIHNACLSRRDVSSVISNRHRVPNIGDREQAVQKPKAYGIEVKQTSNFSEFMEIVAASLKTRYGVAPVHTAAEMHLLAARFPENIKLFTAKRAGKLLAGVIVYESENVAHVQYIGSTPKGRALGALDAVVDVLLNDVYREKPYFDFGISTVDEGRRLNHGLIQNKEGFGARATVYDFYELDFKP